MNSQSAYTNLYGYLVPEAQVPILGLKIYDIKI